MNVKLFWLIHNERPYRRYYYQPNDLKHPNRLGWGREIKLLFLRYAKAAYLPFCPQYNNQYLDNQIVAAIRGAKVKVENVI